MLLKHFHLWGCGPGFVVTAKNTAVKPSGAADTRMCPFSIFLWTKVISPGIFKKTAIFQSSKGEHKVISTVY